MVLTGFLWWQSIFQNNVVLFDKRLSCYQRFATHHYQFLSHFPGHLFKLMTVIGGDLDDKEKKDLLISFSMLEGVVFEMKMLDFSKEINSDLDKAISNCRTVLQYFYETIPEEKSKKTEALTESVFWLEELSKENSEFAKKLHTEIKLRNFRFYVKAARSKICKWICINH